MHPQTAAAAGFVCPNPHIASQVDIIVDETYAPDPTAYDLAAFLGTFNLTAADKAKYKWLAGAVPKASCCCCCTAAHSQRNVDVSVLRRPYLFDQEYFSREAPLSAVASASVGRALASSGLCSSV